MRTPTVCAFLVLLCMAATWARSAAQDQAQTCVDVSSSERLNRGSAYSVDLPLDLEFRLSPMRMADGGSYGWTISVGPKGERDDFLWVVSPPLRTAPHRMIGAGYGLTARESVGIIRTLRFALNRHDYEEAVRLVETEPAASALLERLRELGRGSLELRITKYEVRDGVDAPFGKVDVLEWIEFEGLACVPR